MFIKFPAPVKRDTFKPPVPRLSLVSVLPEAILVPVLPYNVTEPDPPLAIVTSVFMDTKPFVGIEQKIMPEIALLVIVTGLVSKIVPEALPKLKVPLVPLVTFPLNLKIPLLLVVLVNEPLLTSVPLNIAVLETV